MIVEHRLGERRRFVDGDRRQVHAVGHVANGIDIADRGARELVDHDMAVPAEIDTGLVEPKPHGVGKPAGGGHDQAGMETVAAFEMDAVTSIYLFDAGVSVLMRMSMPRLRIASANPSRRSASKLRKT